MKGNIRALLREFCLEGTVLGLKYFFLFPDKLSRCYWASIILFILYFAGMMTFFLYRRFEAMPTRITIENQFEPVASLPYPAVTLCSPNQMTISAVRHFDQSLVNGNRSLDLTTTLRQLLGFYHFINVDEDHLDNLQTLIDLNRYTVPEVLVLLPQSCDSFLRRCIFQQRRFYRCRGLFTPVLTKYGLCCSFNSFYKYKTNRKNERNMSFVPHLAGRSNPFYGLTVLTDYEPDDSIDGTVHFAGATKIMFTDWTEFPTDDESMLLPPNSESYHFIHATATYASSDVKDLLPDSRKCVLEEEHHLPFFGRYRNSDCDLLCLVHAVEQRCGCLLPYIPHLPLLRVCDVTAIPCITLTKLKMDEYQEHAQCECPRDCDSRRYRVDATIGNFDGLPYMFTKPFGTVQLNRSSSLMHFVFPTPVYEKQKQETVVSLTTLASNLGGVFGLCVGCSVISVLELLFYVSRAARTCARAHTTRAPPTHTRPYCE